MTNFPSKSRNRPLHAGCSALLFLGTISLLLTGCRPHDFPTYPANYREYLYVTNGGSNTVTVLDVVNVRLDRTIRVGNNPTGIAINTKRNEVYVVNSGSNSVSVINTEKNAVVATIPVHQRPYFISVSTDGTRAYVANSGSNNVSVLDLDKRREIAVIGVGESPGEAVISPDGRTLVVSNRRSNSVSVVDAKSLRVRSVFSGCPGATDIAILPHSEKAFIACSGGHQVMVLALAVTPTPAQTNSGLPTKDALLDLLDVGKTPVHLALKPDSGEIFVSNFGSNSISEIDTGTNEVGGAYIVGANPSNGIVSADNSTLYVSNFGAESLSIFSVDEAQLVGSARAGDGPDGLAFSAVGHLLFAVDSRSGDVAVIRTLTHTLFTMLPTGSKPNAIVDKAFTVRSL
ncbi:MAG TPA: beta-propeller fold lactonase family protein [Acidobacteriaceae bacterium]|jgi:YVTN family beta-propeller protein|nr:beta-propeller fold lactonase family protein [Acidobacteriaceae bacterium]